MRTHAITVLGLTALLASDALAGSQTVTITASKDNTLYESGSGVLSNGIGDHFFTGQTLQSSVISERRAVLEFDVASNVPEGATIEQVSIVLQLDRANASGPFDFTFHRVLQEWGEGTSHAAGQEGGGGLSTPGDATWIHAVNPGTLWMNPGGDFDPTPSRTVLFGEEAQYIVGSSTELVSDVQGWLDDDTTNHGWLILGPQGVGGVATAKRFSSVQNGAVANRPMLSVTYSEASVCAGDCDDSGAVNFADLVAMLFEFGTPGSVAGCDADESGTVNFSDLVAALFLFGPCP